MTIKLLAAGALAALAAAASAAGAQAPVMATPLAAGTIQATTFHVKTGGAVLDRYTLAPGGSFGWHEHNAPVAVIVQQGTLTVRDPSIAKCAPFKVTKGMAFVEPAGHVHLARNDGATTAKVYAMYLGLPKSAPSTVPASAPAGCTA
jgi:quercetin dioxygenase-like cupin family protein